MTTFKILESLQKEVGVFGKVELAESYIHEIDAGVKTG